MKNTLTRRSGLTIIEVLTSIVVAMIGVFGIMVMIPFSVKQSQTGLDRDAATMLARNAMADFEIQGYRNPGTWRDTIGAVDPASPSIYMIDPLHVTENGGAFFNFPYNIRATTPIFPYTIPTASLSNHAGANMSVAEARRMFIGKNELVFGDPPAELDGPEQFLDESSLPAIGELRRQYGGTLTWSVLMVPYKSLDAPVGAAWSYRAYVIIYKSRDLDPTAGNIESEMFSARVAQLPPTPAPNGFSQVGLASPVGSVYLDTATFLRDEYNIAKGSWVMMINRRINADPGPPTIPAEVGFEHQIGFYRVINYDITEGGPGARTWNSVMLDGPDFDFGNADGTDWHANGTHVVHLKDVIAVYERNITPESNSNWN